jgi:inosose dehydratase
MPDLVSCFTNSYLRFGARAAIENLRAAGLECLELGIRTAGVPTFFGDEPLVTDASTSDELKAVDELLAEHGVRVTSCNVTSGNPLDPAVVATTCRKIERAAHFGVDRIVGGAGDIEDESQRETLYANLRKIGDFAAAHGMIYCFETHPGLCVDHRGMLRAMQDLDHPNLRINFDTGNIHYYNKNIESEIALAKVCQFVAHVHLKDSTGEFEDWNFAELGTGGAVDFWRVRELMHGCGFTGPFSIELEGIRGEPDQPLEVYQQRIANSVKFLRENGFEF